MQSQAVPHTQRLQKDGSGLLVTRPNGKVTGAKALWGRPPVGSVQPGVHAHAPAAYPSTDWFVAVHDQFACSVCELSFRETDVRGRLCSETDCCR